MELQRKMKNFYEVFADGVFMFSDGTTIKVSKILIAAESQALEKKFLDVFPNNVVTIPNVYDSITFKLFLNCMLGFQELLPTDALLIFPMAWNYEVKNLLKKCMVVLTPTELNENVCQALNIALFCKCQELCDIIIEFLDDKKLFFKVLDDEKYCFKLEPEPIKHLLALIYNNVDSYTLVNIFKWGENYLKSNRKNMKLKNFFDELRIEKYLNFCCFETLSAFIEFNNSFGKEYFTEYDARLYSTLNSCKSGKSKFFHIKAGETITENYMITKVRLQLGYSNKVRVFRNPVIFYSYPKNYESPMILLNVDSELNSEVRINKCMNMENRENDFFEKGVFFANIFHRYNSTVDIDVTLKFQFLFDCRILKTSIDDTENGDENLSFVHDVDVINIEK